MTELGKKHECVSCGARFYDLGRSELICPRCGTDQKDPAKDTSEGASAGAASGKGSKKKAAKKKKKKKAAAK